MSKDKKYDRVFDSGGLSLPDEDLVSDMDLRQTEAGIKFVKDIFQQKLAEELNLRRVSAPISVLSNTGLNDGLTGAEAPVSFDIQALGKRAEIVHSLAKWKRKALRDYGFISGEGLYTDMNALRTSEELDNVHSIYVDQWDWERIIADHERDLGVLKYIVKKIYSVLKEVEEEVCHEFSDLADPFLPPEIEFVHSEDLLEKYPDKTPEEREEAIAKEKQAVFIIGCGAELADGSTHEIRAADYDDWITETKDGKKGLNGDILVWNPVLNSSLELSSMGIRVDKETMLKQLKIRDEEHKKEQPFHQQILNNELPQSIGGGIGQSRSCMFFLRKAHIGEVQAGIWSDEMREVCLENGIQLL